MRSTFYDNLITTVPIMQLVSEELSQIEQEEIHEMIEDILHHRIMEVMLLDLPQEHHENFLLKFHQNPTDPDLFFMLKKHSPKIEEKIQEVVVIVHEELKSDLLIASLRE